MEINTKVIEIMNRARNEAMEDRTTATNFVFLWAAVHLTLYVGGGNDELAHAFQLVCNTMPWLKEISKELLNEYSSNPAKPRAPSGPIV